jgi:alpha-L-fucosidase
MSCKMNDIAAAKLASADSALGTNPASNATDADLNSMWVAADANANHWVKVDLNSAVSVKGVVFKFEAAGAYGYKVETSATGSLWAIKKTGTSAPNATSQDVNFASVSARYVRVTLTSLPTGRSAALSSVRVY